MVVSVEGIGTIRPDSRHRIWKWGDLMSRIARWLIAIGISGALVISVVAFVLYRISAGITASVEHKSAKTTSATVLSVSEVEPAKPLKGGDSDRLFKVCFTIDNLDQVETDMRHGYQAAETQRLASDGPRCKVTAKSAIAKNLNKGDKLSVVYLLENQYRIDLVAITAFGEDL
ncbi:MAG TPA: hypothetical protein VG225_05535 [Terracidiphilus sp.]|nr:hypothetical protein [Terracidiphilus sp.]